MWKRGSERKSKEEKVEESRRAVERKEG